MILYTTGYCKKQQAPSFTSNVLRGNAKLTPKKLASMIAGGLWNVQIKNVNKICNKFTLNIIMCNPNDME